MTFTTEKIEPDIAVVRGEGKLNMVSAPELRTLVLRVIEEGENRVVVDLSGIEFMDSSGLGALVGCLKSARQAGGDLRIASPSPQVSMVLRLSNLDRVLASFDSAEDAYRV
ncbi:MULTISPECIES: STAS domain-containing protein [Rathayibacter]|jgi:anti-sigma B factor antagonist|uniref:Anti-sigma factor antagonist n=1 Tax=Rathayibacter caricis DSM 15933 TaxID=1328867 RepID=A0A2T4USG1_9MICO|nr:MULTISPECIES: STAS domain-containing protein [Rathayibacter]KQQ09698.1 anti-anti-sigma factor [Rathayibacter sp. Leaf296]KQQ21935.1 anti-anti-sigma factor [Rathayibacter sp. Leaf299]MCJ1697277.1 STAS domain-containing protein [Rathayibacter caricis]OOB92289.1 anti-anti-sigma factor [Rathayibacter sp. VKM Ac-2630]PTL72469.1 anti-sigma factor antagonist [Rathayibacter caricis DSM 15933]